MATQEVRSREVRCRALSAAAYCTIKGYPILRIEEHPDNPSASTFILPGEARAALAEWFDASDALHERIARERRG